MPRPQRVVLTRNDNGDLAPGLAPDDTDLAADTD